MCSLLARFTFASGSPGAIVGSGFARRTSPQGMRTITRGLGAAALRPEGSVRATGTLPSGSREASALAVPSTSRRVSYLSSGNSSLRVQAEYCKGAYRGSSVYSVAIYSSIGRPTLGLFVLVLLIIVCCVVFFESG